MAIFTAARPVAVKKPATQILTFAKGTKTQNVKASNVAGIAQLKGQGYRLAPATPTPARPKPGGVSGTGHNARAAEVSHPVFMGGAHLAGGISPDALPRALRGGAGTSRAPTSFGTSIGIAGGGGGVAAYASPGNFGGPSGGGVTPHYDSGGQPQNGFGGSGGDEPIPIVTGWSGSPGDYSGVLNYEFNSDVVGSDNLTGPFDTTGDQSGLSGGSTVGMSGGGGTGGSGFDSSTGFASGPGAY